MVPTVLLWRRGSEGAAESGLPPTKNGEVRFVCPMVRYAARPEAEYFVVVSLTLSTCYTAHLLRCRAPSNPRI
jgi:hypothetical protein